jgi:hypothetical protein
MSQVKIDPAEVSAANQHVIPYTLVPVEVNTNVNQSQTTINNVTNINAPTGTISVTINSGTTAAQVTDKPDHYIMPGYSGPVGCPYPMTDLDFDNVKHTIEEKSFEDSKLTIAKQVVSSNCLFASEVKEIMDLFSFEDSRLDFAKFAYRYTFDLGNYYKVNAAFHFETTIDELNAFIQQQHHH